jgi:tyrosine-protein phosphatase SIW14
MRFSSFIFVLSVLGTLSLATVPLTGCPDGSAPSVIAQKISITGVRNAGKVNEHLYRGAQPHLTDLFELKKLGITTIIDLRAESSALADLERIRAELLGMRFLRIPIGGFSTPDNSDLAQFFRVLSDSPPQTIFIHCEFGEDRTGVMIASYRIVFEHWSADQALSEMIAFGFNRWAHRSMAVFIRKLPDRLKSDPDLRKALNPPSTAMPEPVASLHSFVRPVPSYHS